MKAMILIENRRTLDEEHVVALVVGVDRQPLRLAQRTLRRYRAGHGDTQQDQSDRDQYGLDTTPRRTAVQQACE